MDKVFRNILFWALIFLVVVAVIGMLRGQGDQAKEYNVKEFTEALDNGQIAEMTMQPKNKIMRITGELKKDKQEFVVQIPDNTNNVSDIVDKAEEQSDLKVAQEAQPSAFLSFLTMMLPFLLIRLIFFFIFTRAQCGGGGGRVMNFGKSKAKLFSQEDAKV